MNVSTSEEVHWVSPGLKIFFLTFFRDKSCYNNKKMYSTGKSNVVDFITTLQLTLYVFHNTAMFCAHACRITDLL